MRRTLHFTNAWHGASGGVRTFYEALLAGAEPHHRHVAIVVPGPQTRTEVRSPWAAVHEIAAPHSPAFDRRYRVIPPWRFAPTRQSVLWRILRDERPDVVEISDKFFLPWLAGLIRWRRGADGLSVVALSHERLDDNVHAWVGGGAIGRVAAGAWMSFVYGPAVDGHIANSDYTAAELRRVVGNDRPVLVAPMGVDTSGFAPERRSTSVRAQLAAPHEVVLVYAGRLSPEKQTSRLPLMLRRLVELGIPARLIVCGDGPQREAVARAAARLTPGRLRLLGHVTKPALATILASADAFVHPNDREPFGIGPLEAMASGLPVVLPRGGGVLSYATDANSWLTPPTAEGLASGVADLLVRPVLRSLRRTQARQDVTRLAWPCVVETYFRHYDALDKARRRRAPAASSRARACAEPRRP